MQKGNLPIQQRAVALASYYSFGFDVHKSKGLGLAVTIVHQTHFKCLISALF